MADHAAHIAAAITEAAKMMHVPRTVDETLDTIVDAAVQTVPGFDHVGISITHRNGEIETRAGTDQLVWELDGIQYSLREGPCYDSITGSTVTVVDNAPTTLGGLTLWTVAEELVATTNGQYTPRDES